MFAFSITFKLMSWWLLLKYGDTGSPSRPWVLGTLVGVVFATFDIVAEYRGLLHSGIIGGAYVFCGLVLAHIYYRTENLALSLLVGAVGTAVLFLGGPFLGSLL